ncbi:DUF4202 domain-containing protein [Gaoshiqia sp. Z1-71]|uniref:DUF4202 domain-containing protein n=1 Tax=Gaoshiqia hydrogeniformans TaxID=3290090 RepID=UPI003BF851E1
MYSPNFQPATEALKAAHLRDPNLELSGTETVPAEWLYISRLLNCLKSVYPDASEPLTIAAYCQHLYRWEIKRTSYPEGKTGYYQWRNFLAAYQAEKAVAILKSSGYDDGFISGVLDILKKLNIYRLEESQKLEDVVCLVFLEHYLSDFMHEKPEAQLVQIVQKTWNKMSEHGHHVALQLNLPEPTRRIVKQALG